jgi:two-component system, LytTR family, sensor kinase
MIWRSWKFWLAVLVAATCVGLLEGAQVYAGASAIGRPVSWAAALGSTMPSWFVMAALLPGVLWMSSRFPLEAGRWRLALLAHLAAAVVFALLHIGFSSWISDYVLVANGPMPFGFRVNLSRLLTIYFMVEIVTYFALVGGYHAYEYSRRFRERENAAAQLALRASRLEGSLTRANLDSLRMQLNPHFLFNTLNAISVMALKGERHGVVRMLTLLSDLLRLSLEQRQQVVPLRQELDFLDRYLEIEQVRFRDRLSVERDIDLDALEAEVPSLLLQPLVENAIRHGIARQPGPGTVRLEASIVRGEVLELRVLDTGVGLSPGRHAAARAVARPGAYAATAEGTGVGLANTRARLEQLYGAEQDLELTNRPGGGACVTVRLPLRFTTATVPDSGIAAGRVWSASA